MVKLLNEFNSNEKFSFVLKYKPKRSADNNHISRLKLPEIGLFHISQLGLDCNHLLVRN